MRLQQRLDQFARQHWPSLATIRWDLTVAIPEVAQSWSRRFANPKDVSGSAFCPDVRVVMGELATARGAVQGLSLHYHRGPNCSVQYFDVGGSKVVSRKFPAKKLDTALEREVVMPPPEQYKQARAASKTQGEQLNLFTTPPAEPKAECVEELYDGLYVLWTLGEDGESLNDAYLCMARDVDNPHRTVVLAAVRLPPVTDSPVYSAPTPPANSGPPKDDFDAHARRDDSTGNDDGPDGPGTTPA